MRVVLAGLLLPAAPVFALARVPVSQSPPAPKQCGQACAAFSDCPDSCSCGVDTEVKGAFKCGGAPLPTPVPAPATPRPPATPYPAPAPVYLCNATSYACELSTPGNGTSMEVCKQSCAPPSTPAAAVGTADPLAGLGPLRGLVGKWHGVRGKVALPANPPKTKVPTTACYMERIEFSPIFPVYNGDVDVDEMVYALRYEIEVWGMDGTPFHNENGQWQWHPKLGQVMRVAAVPRGNTLQATVNLTWGSGMNGDNGVSLPTATRKNADIWNSGAFAHDQSVVDFTSKYTVKGNTLWYNDTTTLSGDGGRFGHSAANCLSRSTLGSSTSPFACPELDIFCDAPKQTR